MNCDPKNSIFSALAAALLLYVPTASAQEEDFDHFSISIGVFLTDRASKTRLDGYYRFNERHRIDISVFDLSRSKTRVIDEEIE